MVEKTRVHGASRKLWGIIRQNETFDLSKGILYLEVLEELSSQPVIKFILV